MTYAAHRISYVFRQSHLIVQREPQNPFVRLHGADPVREQLPDTGPVLGQTENAHSTGARGKIWSITWPTWGLPTRTRTPSEPVRMWMRMAGAIMGG